MFHLVLSDMIEFSTPLDPQMSFHSLLRTERSDQLYLETSSERFDIRFCSAFIGGYGAVYSAKRIREEGPPDRG